MSINKFQEKVFRSGCGTAVLFVSAGVFFAGMFYMGCGAGQTGTNPDQEKQKVVVTVGDQSIFASDLDTELKARLDQARMQGPDPESGELPPTAEAQTAGMTIGNDVNSMCMVYLADKEGVKFTDAQLTDEAEKFYQQQLIQGKMQLASQLKLSPGASDKEFDAALAKMKQPTLTERHTDFQKGIASRLKTTDGRRILEMGLAGNLLSEAIQAKLAPSDAELKASYDTYTFKKILFGTDTGATADAQIAKAQVDLKAGLTFEQAMDRYSKEPPPKGKKVSDNTELMDATELDRNKSDAPLKNLKPGEVSGVIDDPIGKAIYKLVSVKNMAPPDLLTNKKKYVEQYAKPKADEEVKSKTQELLKSSVVKWSSPGYKALFDWYEALTDFSAATPVSTRMEPVVAEAKKAATDNQGYDARAGLLAWYAAVDSLWSAPGADQVKLRKDRIEATKAMAQDTPYFSLKLELVDLYLADKSQDAGPALLEAAKSNTVYDSTGTKNFQDVNDRVQKLKDAKLLTPELEKAIGAAQDDWTKENQDVEQQKAAAKKAADEQQKADAALKAQQMAEKAKADAANKAKGGSTTPPATTGTTSGAPAPATAGSTAGTPAPAPVKTGTTGATAGAAATGSTTGKKP